MGFWVRLDVVVRNLDRFPQFFNVEQTVEHFRSSDPAAVASLQV